MTGWAQPVYKTVESHGIKLHRVANAGKRLEKVCWQK